MNPVTIIVLNQTFILLLSVVIIMTRGKGRFKDFGFSLPQSLHLRLTAPLALTFGVAATSILLLSTSGDEGNPLLSNLSWLEKIVLIWICASVCEEVLFRGVAQTNLSTWTNGRTFDLLGVRIGLGSLMAAVLFAVDHLATMLILGTGVVTTVVITLFAFVTGVTAGYSRDKSNSLIPAIVVHMLANVGAALPAIAIELFG
jgi:membrane protease YdiL (CAAX protease family)